MNTDDTPGDANIEETNAKFKLKKISRWIRKDIGPMVACTASLAQILAFIAVIIGVWNYWEERKLRAFNALTQWKDLQRVRDIQALSSLIQGENNLFRRKIIGGDYDCEITVTPEQASTIRLFMKQEYREISEEDIFIPKDGVEKDGDAILALTPLAWRTVSNKILDYIEIYEHLCVFWHHGFGYNEILEEQFVHADPVTGRKKLAGTFSAIYHILGEMKRGYDDFPNIVRIIAKYQ